MAPMTRQNLGEMLLAANLIDEVQMKIALAEQQRTGRKFGSTLVDLKFIDENVLAAFLSRQIDVPCISLLHVDVSRKTLRRIPYSIAALCQAVPIREEDGSLEVAMVDPTDHDTISRLEATAGMTIVPLVAPQSSILKIIDRFYPAEEEDTITAHPGSGSGMSDPLFADLIEEIESGDIGERLRRLEQKIDQVWTLLEKVLRTVEAARPAGTTPSVRPAAEEDAVGRAVK
jgi:type IV pilus assembly protein PilB